VSWGGACGLDHVVAVLAVEVVWSRSRRLKDGTKAMKTRNPSASLRFFHLADAASCFLHPSKQQEEASRGGCPTHNSPPTRHIQSTDDQSCPASLCTTPWPARDTHRRRPPARLRQHRLLELVGKLPGVVGLSVRWSCAVPTYTPSHVNKTRIVQAKKRDCRALVDGNKGSFWRAWEFVVDAFDGAKSWAENGPRLSMDRGGFGSCIE